MASRARSVRWRGHSKIPAIQAERKLARVPASRARKPSRARSCRRSGARAPIPPSWMPIELKLANPQRAKLAITNDRSMIGCSFSLPSSLKGNQLVEHRARAQQAARRRGSPPRARPAGRPPGREPSRRSPGATCPSKPSPMLIRAIRPRNAISMAAMLRARCRPSRVPRAAASRTLASLRSLGRVDVAQRLGLSVSGTSILDSRIAPGRRHDHGRQDVPGLDAKAK